MGGRCYGFAFCFWNVSGRTAASSVRAAPCQLPRRGSFCSGLSGAEFIGTHQGSSQDLPHRGRGTARRRWMRGGAALRIAGTMGAEVETFLRIRLQFPERFRSLRGPSSVRATPCQLPRRGSFCTMYWAVPFTRTGYTSNVAGGRLPPLHLMYHVFCILWTQNRYRMRKYTSDSLQNCQLSIVHCQLEHHFQ